MPANPSNPSGDQGVPVALPVYTPQPHRMSKRRFTVLIVVQVIIILHIVLWLLGRHFGWFGGLTLSPIEPSDGMELVKYGVINAGAIFFAITLLATLLLGRWFCGWACHVVLLQDFCYWLMRKFGIRPRPFRARLLAWFPLALAFYMFVWPVVYRLAIAPWLQPKLRWPGFSVHLLTEDYWSNFAGPIMAIPFLLVCGFAAVYALGGKGFCTYGCPYGGFYAPLEQASRGRIRVTDDCRHCGRCTAACTSNVRVHEEVRTWGMVTDPGCMKTLDCVSTCPNNALYYGFGPSAIGKREHRGVMPPKPHDLTLWGEVAIGAVFLVSFFSFRGLYAAIPMLMAVGMALVGTWILWKAWRTLRTPNVSLHRWRLRVHGAMQPAGRRFFVVATVVLLFTLQSAAVGGLRVAGDFMAASGDPSTALRFYRLSGPMTDGGIGLASNPNVDLASARYLESMQQFDAAESMLHRVESSVGPNEIASMRIGQVMQRHLDPLVVEEFYESRLADHPDWPLVWEDHVADLIRRDARAKAVDASRRARDANHQSIRLVRQGVFVELNFGDINEGILLLQRIIVVDPNDIEARWTLLDALEDAGREAEATALSNQLMGKSAD
ncbi:MAG: 4Fe-4S binding protein [Phycisphaerales bacterium]|jgi:polyferredoxin|nr:4Fe-4S binding protein [Phycisphaerales bacterium]